MCRWHLAFAQVAVAAQQEGIEYIGMRNEQAACYAAQVTLSEYCTQELSSSLFTN